MKVSISGLFLIDISTLSDKSLSLMSHCNLKKLGLHFLLFLVRSSISDLVRLHMVLYSCVIDSVSPHSSSYIAKSFLETLQWVGVDPFLLHK